MAVPTDMHVIDFTSMLCLDTCFVVNTTYTTMKGPGTTSTSGLPSQKSKHS